MVEVFEDGQGPPVGLQGRRGIVEGAMGVAEVAVHLRLVVPVADVRGQRQSLRVAGQRGPVFAEM